MKTVIFKAGDGFLYVDLLTAMVILFLTLTVLFSSYRSLMETRAKADLLLQTSMEAYESTLLEQIQK